MNDTKERTKDLLGELRQAAAELEEAQAKHRRLLLEAARDEEIGYGEIAKAAGFGESGGARYVGRLAREAGIPPRKGGPRRRP